MSVDPWVIATALGRTVPSEQSPEFDQWEMWIADAQRAITRRAERLDIDPVTLDPDDVDYVVREAVTDHIKHPDNATQVSVSVDDANVSRTYRSGRGRVTIIPEWWELLFPTAATHRATEIDTMPNPTVLR